MDCALPVQSRLTWLKVLHVGKQVSDSNIAEKNPSVIDGHYLFFNRQGETDLSPSGCLMRRYLFQTEYACIFPLGALKPL
jgi:hypothetical protein